MGAGLAWPADRLAGRAVAVRPRPRDLPGQARWPSESPGAPRATRATGKAVDGTVASGSGSQDGLVSPSATMTAGPVSRLAVASGATASLPPGTSTVQGRLPLPGHSPDAAAAAAAAASGE